MQLLLGIRVIMRHGNSLCAAASIRSYKDILREECAASLKPASEAGFMRKKDL
jgi:hypothetical protein